MRGIPMFELALTSDHVEVLREIAAHHYDGKCRAAGHDTSEKERGGLFPDRNGFLTGWLRLLEPRPGCVVQPPEKIDADWHELDTCLKIIEMAGTMFGRLGGLESPRKLGLATEMMIDFNHAMNVAREAMKTWKAAKPEHSRERDDAAQA